MLAHLAKINLAASLLVLGCFFLPWISIDCNNDAVVRLSGFQMATGRVEPDRTVLKRIGKETGSDVRTLRDVDREHQAGAKVHFFVVIVCALGIGYYAVRMWVGRNRVQLVATAAMAGVGLLFLLVLGLADFGLTIPPELALVIDTTYQIGFYLTFLAFLGALAVNAICLVGYTDPRPVAAAAASNMPPLVITDMPDHEQYAPELGSDMLANVYPGPDPGMPPEAAPEQAAPQAPAGARTCPKCGAPAGEYQVQCMKCGARMKPGKREP